HGLAVAHFIFRFDAAPDDLFGRDAIYLLRPRTHELNATARDDEGLETIRSQIGKQLDHRLINAFGVGALEFRMFRSRDPISDNLLEPGGGHAATGGQDDLQYRVVASGKLASQITFDQRGKWI